jgi:hypothetical protein
MMRLNRLSGLLFFAWLLVYLLCSQQFAWGEPVTTIINNGDPNTRVGLVVLGDGYTSSELTKYANDVNNMVNGFFGEDPFKEYQTYFNVYRVDVVSSESGADHPEANPPVYKNTALDATFNCSGIQRLICVNNNKVNNILTNSNVTINMRDIVLVVVNDSTYGGSGGAIAVVSTNSSSLEIAKHEIGHSFGWLADEYTYSPPTCYNTVEPAEPNVTMETQRGKIKWNQGGGPPLGWIAVSTPVPWTNPTPPSDHTLPGLFQGAKYCPTGLYRPTYDSKMNNLGQPYGPINEEQLVRRIYNKVAPITQSNPPGNYLLVHTWQSQLFQVTVPVPVSQSLTGKWYLDNHYQQAGLSYNLAARTLRPGLHTLRIDVQDPTPKVRYDPENLLQESHSWTLKITPPALPYLLLLMD